MTWASSSGSGQPYITVWQIRHSTERSFCAGCLPRAMSYIPSFVLRPTRETNLLWITGEMNNIRDVTYHRSQFVCSRGFLNLCPVCCKTVIWRYKDDVEFFHWLHTYMCWNYQVAWRVHAWATCIVWNWDMFFVFISYLRLLFLIGKTLL